MPYPQPDIPPPPNLSKHQQTEELKRLRKEGNYEKFQYRKQDLKEELVRAGVYPATAINYSWILALAEFPPVPKQVKKHRHYEKTPLAKSHPDTDALTTKNFPPKHTKDINFQIDAQWTYDNLTNKQTNLKSAPHTGAIHLLLFAQKFPHHFYRMHAKTHKPLLSKTKNKKYQALQDTIQNLINKANQNLLPNPTQKHP